MAAAKPPPPPRDLGAAGKSLWRRLTAEFTFHAAEIEILRQLATTADQIAAMETEMSTMGVIVAGSENQPRLNPILPGLVSHKKLFDQLVTALALPIGNETAGRRRSAAARQAAGTPRIKLAPKVAAIRSKQERDRGA
jgi:hypothetical protein